MTGVLAVFLCHLFLIYHGIQGYTTMSKDDDLELENKLKLLNKPAIKTIQTVHGQLYDCVDFYKQPAFDHPLLRNHKYNYKIIMKNKNAKVSSKVDDRLRFRLRGGGCPMGSVPIKRKSKEDLIRVKRAAKRLAVGGTHYAVVQTNSSHANQFYGAQGYISIYAPSAQGQQYSEARIKIQNGENGNEFIQTGWRVDPTFYGDALSHQFIQTSTPKAKCLDLQCGFVVVAKDLSPGLIWSTVSVPGTQGYNTKQTIKREADGNWWLYIGESDNNQVGFWPHELFQELSDYGTYVDWGGEVYSPPGTPGPPMGSGSRPGNGDTLYDAFVREIQVFDHNGNPQDTRDTLVYNDAYDQYKVVDDPTYRSNIEHIMFFGGSDV